MNFAILDLALVRGIVAGFALAAPMGPVAMLCVRRALTLGRMHAFVAGLGAALADMIFGAAAGLGITVVNVFVTDHQTAIGLIGGIVVLSIGLATYRMPVTLTQDRLAGESLRRDVAASFSMAITNPATMGAAAGLFAAFGPINMHAAPAAAFWLVAGVFAGSALWWLLLVGAVGWFREGLVTHRLAQLNRISGTVITVSGVAVLAAVIVKALAN